MKKFNLKISVFLLPVVFAFLVLEILIRYIPNDYSYKKSYLDENAKNIETLILGSSHSYYGINPEYFKSNTFNASHISQSIDLDYKILYKYKEDLTKLKRIVLPIDYFTFYYKLSTGIEFWRGKNYDIYYHINNSNRISDKAEILSIGLKKNIKRIKTHYLKTQESITCSKLGYGHLEVPQFNLEETGKASSLRHTYTTSIDFEENVAMLDLILKTAREMEVEVILLTSPAFKTYVENIDSGQLKITLGEINRLVQKYPNSSYFNFLADKSFTELDFRDADHLNSAGSKKLSIELNNIVEENKVN